MPLTVKKLDFSPGLVFILIFALALTSCGKIGDPLPPGAVDKLTISDLTAQAEKRKDSLSCCSENLNMAETVIQEKD